MEVGIATTTVAIVVIIVVPVKIVGYFEPSQGWQGVRQYLHLIWMIDQSQRYYTCRMRE